MVSRRGRWVGQSCLLALERQGFIPEFEEAAFVWGRQFTTVGWCARDLYAGTCAGVVSSTAHETQMAGDAACRLVLACVTV